jgi:hypothetical protein
VTKRRAARHDGELRRSAVVVRRRAMERERESVRDLGELGQGERTPWLGFYRRREGRGRDGRGREREVVGRFQGAIDGVGFMEESNGEEKWKR